MVEVGGVAGDQLRSYIERIERLEEEKAALAADVREVLRKPRVTASMLKLCGRCCAYGKWMATTGPNRKPYWMYTNVPLG